jgi:hypothetical protein
LAAGFIEIRPQLPQADKFTDDRIWFANLLNASRPSGCPSSYTGKNDSVGCSVCESGEWATGHLRRDVAKWGAGGCGEICSCNEDQALKPWNNNEWICQTTEIQKQSKASIKRMLIIRPREIADSRLSQK